MPRLKHSPLREIITLECAVSRAYIKIEHLRPVQSGQERTMATVKVDNKNFKSEVLDSNVPVVVDFWAEWCGPCKMIGPSLEELSSEMAGSVKIVKVNIDENPELGAQYGVRSIPTLLIFKAGERADIKVGAAPKTVLSSWIKNAAA
jgi:thioredoxin 1